MDRFRGVFPAPVTPMTSAGEFDDEVFARVLEFNLQAGVHGFWLAGGTGESVLLDDEENERMASVAADVVGDRGATIMHVGSPTTRRSAVMAEHAAAAGVDAICCLPPVFYARSEAEIVEHYRAVAAAADLPFFVYNLPSMTGIEITPDLMRKIADAVPQLVGLKHSASNYANLQEFMAMDLPACFIGNCLLLLPSLSLGAVGCIDGPPNMAPEVFVEVWDAFHAGDMERARTAQERGRQIKELIRECGPHHFHAVLKTIVGERIGYDCGDPRRPGLALSPEQREHILAKAAAFGLTRATVEV